MRHSLHTNGGGRCTGQDAMQDFILRIEAKSNKTVGKAMQSSLLFKGTKGAIQNLFPCCCCPRGWRQALTQVLKFTTPLANVCRPLPRFSTQIDITTKLTQSEVLMCMRLPAMMSFLKQCDCTVHSSPMSQLYCSLYSQQWTHRCKQQDNKFNQTSAPAWGLSINS